MADGVLSRVASADTSTQKCLYKDGGDQGRGREILCRGGIGYPGEEGVSLDSREWKSWRYGTRPLICKWANKLDVRINMNNKRRPTHRKHHRLHDYKSRCIYHITLVVSDRVPLFGRMVGETVDEARVEHSELGFAISEEI